MFARYGIDAGFSVAPTTRTCCEKVLLKLVTITLTMGSVIYWLSASLMSCWSIVGVLPTAGISVISGVVIRPSGRTWTLPPSSGFRHTKIWSSSSGPMIYSSPGPSWFATKLALGSCGAVVPAPMHPVSAVAAMPEISAARAARSEGKDVMFNSPFERTGAAAAPIPAATANASGSAMLEKGEHTVSIGISCVRACRTLCRFGTEFNPVR